MLDVWEDMVDGWYVPKNTWSNADRMYMSIEGRRKKGKFFEIFQIVHFEKLL